MPSICVLNKNTNQCVGVYEIASISDWRDHGDLILSPRHDGQAGWSLVNGEWHDPAVIVKSEADKWAEIRRKRDDLLVNSDKYILSDYPLTEAQKSLVVAYRAALRDLPQTYSTADAVIFPDLDI